MRVRKRYSIRVLQTFILMKDRPPKRFFFRFNTCLAIEYTQFSDFLEVETVEAMLIKFHLTNWLILTDVKTDFQSINLLYTILQNPGTIEIHVSHGLLHCPLPDIQIGKMNQDVSFRGFSTKLTATVSNAGIIIIHHLPGSIIRMP